MGLKNKLKKGEKEYKELRGGIDTSLPILIGMTFHAYFFLAIFIELANFNKNTISLTNYGFAILIGISAVCFSWARNLQPSNEKRAARITDNAVDALYGAIAFILGSALKYIVFATDIKFYSFVFHDHWLGYIPKSLSFLCFLIATYKSSVVIRELLKIISLHKLSRSEETKDDKTWE